jgi:phage baseplate assembly protein V
MTGSPAIGLERVMRRLQLLVGLGRIRVGNDAGNVQLQQVQFNERETQDDMPRVAEYGFASMPLPGCQAIVLFIGGERTNGAVIGTNDEAHRMKNLQRGEVAIYDDQGQSVYITRAGIIVNGGGKNVTITNTPKVRMETSLDVTGDIKDKCDGTGKTMAAMRTTYNSHHHNDPQGGTVDVPNEQM